MAVQQLKLTNRILKDGRKLTRDQAVKDGYGFFRTGIACAKGHLTFRYVIGGHCVYCQRANHRRKTGHGGEDQEAVTLRRALEDRPRKPKDEYDYDL